MRYIGPAVVWTLAVLVLPVLAVAAEQECGLHCLYLSAKALGVEAASLEKLRTQLGPISNQGYSLKQIEDAAVGLGLHALSVQTTLDDLRRFERPLTCIATMKTRDNDQKHFVLIGDVSDSLVWMIDGPLSSDLPRATFEGSWEGTALLLSVRPIQLPPPETDWSGWYWWASGGMLIVGLFLLLRQRFSQRTYRGMPRLAILLTGVWALAGCAETGPPERPALLMRTTSLDAGVLKIGEEKTVSFDLENSGRADLILQDIVKSCTCFDVVLGQSKLKPGESTQLAMTIRSLTPGIHHSHVKILSNDPDRPSEVARVKFESQSEFEFEPPELNLGNVLPHVKLEKTFILRRKIVDESVRMIAWKCPPGIEISPTESQEFGTPVRVIVDTGDVPGDHHAQVSPVFTGTPVQMRLPVTWRVSPEVQFSPTELFLGQVQKGQEGVGTMIASLVETLPTDGWSWSSEDKDMQLEFSSNSSRHKILKVRWLADPHGGSVRSSTIVFRRGTREYQIPVSMVLATGALP